MSNKQKIWHFYSIKNVPVRHWGKYKYTGSYSMLTIFKMTVFFMLIYKQFL